MPSARLAWPGASSSYARIGLALSLGWLAALIPFLGRYAIVNVIALVLLMPWAWRIYRHDKRPLR